MKFVHCSPVDLKDLDTVNINGKRYYITDGGKYPSITTILSSFNKKSLYEWRARIGNEEANRISSIASSRGRAVHSLCEKYLLNEEVTNKSSMQDSFSIFKSMRPLLNNINNIHFLECALYSNILKVAGRCDCIAEYNGILSVIDHKTSSRIKTEDYIEDYFIQACFYSLAYYEMTGIKIPQIVILMGVEADQPIEFIKPAKEYYSKLAKKIKDYRKNLTQVY